MVWPTRFAVGDTNSLCFATVQKCVPDNSKNPRHERDRVSRNGKNLQTSNEPKNDSFHVYILYRSHSRWWSLKSLTNMQKSTAPGQVDTHGHDRVDLKNFDFSYEQLRKEICTTIFTNRIILSPRGQSIKRSTNKSKPLIIHFTYLYMIINCVSLFSRKGCCCVCVCVYVSVCVCVLVWFTKGKYSLQTSYCVFKDQIIL